MKTADAERLCESLNRLITEKAWVESDGKCLTLAISVPALVSALREAFPELLWTYELNRRLRPLRVGGLSRP